MLVGEVPGRWPPEDAVRAGRFLEATATHRTRLSDAAGARVEGALVRGLAIRHDQRTATPAALIDELSGATVPRRRYSGGEVQEIVQRAAELEATAPTAGGAMTIGGVEALAAEVGIARDVVRAAVQSLTPAGAGADRKSTRLCKLVCRLLLEKKKRNMYGSQRDVQHAVVRPLQPRRR